YYLFAYGAPFLLEFLRRRCWYCAARAGAGPSAWCGRRRCTRRSCCRVSSLIAPPFSGRRGRSAGKGGSRDDQRRQIASPVNDTGDFDAVGDLAEKDEIFADGEAPQ